MRGGTENPTDVRYELIPESTDESLVADPLAFARRHLRGRISLVILLALLLGGTFATAAYMFSPVTWQSNGRIRVSAGEPTVLYGSGRIESKVGMKNFAQAQAMLISSRDVVARAVNSPLMREVGWPQTDEGVQALQNAIGVGLEGSDQFITVSTTTGDPLKATAAVEAILESYLRTYKEREHVSPNELKQRLAERDTSLVAQLSDLREQLLNVSDQYGLEALEQMHGRKVEELIAVDQKLAEIAIAATAMEAAVSGDSSTPHPAAAAHATHQNTPATDALRERERTLVAEIQSWRDKYGPAHPMIRELTRQLEAVRIRIDLRTTVTSSPAEHNHMSLLEGPPSESALERLRVTEQAYINSRSLLRSEASTLGNRLAQARGIEEHINELRTQLTDTRHRLDALTVEHTPDDDAMLVSIDSRASMPTAPIKDRRSGMAGAAGLFGIVLAFAIVLLIGLIDPRCRYVSELAERQSGTPVLGIIPDITSRAKDICDRSALAVHQLRNLLQLRTRDETCAVIAVSSAGEGEGKTSLTLALGASFAAAGARTLLIDGDVVKGGLSRETGLDHLPGLYQGLGMDESGGEIHRTRTDYLWVLPVGKTGGFDPRLVSCQRLQRLIESMRSQFDAVIIDTGAIMTSLCGSIICSSADQTLLLAARHQHGQIVDDAIERLAEAQANVIGFVFNRAPECDLHRHDLTRDDDREAAALVPDAHTGPVTTIGSLDVRSAGSAAQSNDGDLVESAA